MHMQQLARCGKVDVMWVGPKIMPVESICNTIVRYCIEMRLWSAWLEVLGSPELCSSPLRIDLFHRINKALWADIAMAAEDIDIGVALFSAAQLIVHLTITYHIGNSKFHPDFPPLVTVGKSIPKKLFLPITCMKERLKGL